MRKTYAVPLCSVHTFTAEIIASSPADYDVLIPWNDEWGTWQ